MGGLYKDHIIANSKFLYGTQHTYDVLVSREEFAPKLAYAYLVAYDLATPSNGTIVRQQRGSHIGEVVFEMHVAVAKDVDGEMGKVVSRGMPGFTFQKGMLGLSKGKDAKNVGGK